MTHTADFLVIGAQKCATSWLYYCLREHPELHLPASKREVHYLGGDLHRQRGTEWYFSLLAGAGPGQKTGDVSVEYLFDPRAPEAVARHLPRARLVAILREPAERAVSACRWHMRKGHLPLTSAGEAVEAVVREFAAGPGEGTSPVLRDVVERGFYDRQLARYLGRLDGEQLLVLLYDEIRAAPLAALERIYRFLGVAPDFEPASLHRRPKRNSRTRWLVRLERAAPRSRLLGKVADVLHGHLAGGGEREPEPPPAVVDLRALYRPHVERLVRLLEGLPAAGRPAASIPDLWLTPRG